MPLYHKNKRDVNVNTKNSELRVMHEDVQNNVRSLLCREPVI
jgi:hypothetical protein